MTDEQIVALYWKRDEAALAETANAHQSACAALARRILGDARDADECLNDVLLRAWNAIPPERPTHLRAYLLKLTRNCALDRLRENRAGKRGGGEVEAALDELSDVLGDDPLARAVEARELGAAVSRFVRALPRTDGDLFLRRYFYADTPAELAARYGLRVNAVAVRLSRIRKKLKTYLTEEGYL